MNKAQWKIFEAFREELKERCKKWNDEFGMQLIPLQKAASEKDTPEYPHETQVVYNTALDELTEESEIKLIVIGDNPGKDEQLSKNQKYLVGQSGKVAASFFSKNPELETDFRKNVIILNKTPVHTAKTKHLKSVAKNGGKQIEAFIQESEIYMAQKTAELHKQLCLAAASSNEKSVAPELWLVGYSELKKNGIFQKYKELLKAGYDDSAELWDKVFVFQHFSMNRFAIDLGEYRKKNPGITLKDAISGLGKIHKKEIFSE